MASSSNLVYLFLFFLLTTLQTHARDNYVFSKVSRNRDDTTLPSNNNYYNNNNENEVTPSFEQQKLDEQPSFLPQTTHSNYGLYGHETTPKTTQIDNNYENPNNFNNNNEKYENVEYSNDENKYVPQLSESSYTNSEFVAQNNHNSDDNNNENVEFGNNENKYVPQLSESSHTNDVDPTKYSYDEANNNHMNNNDHDNDNIGESKHYESRVYNGKKNFYDVDGETKFDAYMKNMELSYSKNFNNNFNNNGKFYGSNKEGLQEENFNNNYYHGNGMNQGYKNQFPEEGEFDFDDQP